jgi:hypothetical protein
VAGSKVGRSFDQTKAELRVEVDKERVLRASRQARAGATQVATSLSGETHPVDA